MITKDTNKSFSRPMDYMIYIFRMHRLIEDLCSSGGDARAKIHLTGKLISHMNACEKEQCICSRVLEQLDDVQA